MPVRHSPPSSLSKSPSMYDQPLPDFASGSANSDSRVNRAESRAVAKESAEMQARIAELEQQLQAVQVNQQQNPNPLQQVNMANNPFALPGGSLNLYGSSFAGLLSPFNGLPGESFQVWLDNFNLVAEDQQWTAEIKRRKLPLLLRGTAREIYNEIPAANMLTFDTMVVALKTKFIRPESTQSSATALMNRTQGLDESVAVYAASTVKLG